MPIVAPIAIALVSLILLAASSVAQNEGDQPLRVDPLHSLISTRRHTCFVTRFNNLRCWGRESRYSALGHGNVTNVGLSPNTTSIRQQGDVPLGARKVLSVATGVDSTCCLLDDFSVKCWGALPNDSGSVLPRDLAPLDVGEKVLQLVMGSFHLCLLLMSGDVKCLGKNDMQQLGTNESVVETAPRLVERVQLGGKAKMLCAGVAHTCAIVEPNDDVVCFGDNSNGQCGFDPQVETLSRAPFRRVPLPLGRYSSLSCGARSTCAIERDSFELRCWGDGSSGRLGIGTELLVAGNVSRAGAVVAIKDASAVPFGVGRKVERVSVGASHACALLNGGGCRCFGFNSTNGQLGYPYKTPIGNFKNNTPDTIDDLLLVDGVRAIDVAAGDEQTCVLLANRKLYCFGAGKLGAIGFNNQSLNVGATLATLPAIVGPVDVGDDLVTNDAPSSSSATPSLTKATSPTTTLATTLPVASSSSSAPTYYWVAILVAALCCCLFLLLLLLLLLRRRRQQQKQPKPIDAAAPVQSATFVDEVADHELVVATTAGADDDAHVASHRQQRRHKKQKSSGKSRVKFVDESVDDSSSSSSSSSSSPASRKN